MVRPPRSPRQPILALPASQSSKTFSCFQTEAQTLADIQDITANQILCFLEGLSVFLTQSSQAAEFDLKQIIHSIKQCKPNSDRESLFWDQVNQEIKHPHRVLHHEVQKILIALQESNSPRLSSDAGSEVSRYPAVKTWSTFSPVTRVDASLDISYFENQAQELAAMGESITGQQLVTFLKELIAFIYAKPPTEQFDFNAIINSMTNCPLELDEVNKLLDWIKTEESYPRFSKRPQETYLLTTIKTKYLEKYADAADAFKRELQKFLRSAIELKKEAKFKRGLKADAIIHFLKRLRRLEENHECLLRIDKSLAREIDQDYQSIASHIKNSDMRRYNEKAIFRQHIQKQHQNLSNSNLKIKQVYQILQPDPRPSISYSDRDAFLNKIYDLCSKGRVQDAGKEIDRQQTHNYRLLAKLIIDTFDKSTKVICEQLRNWMGDNATGEGAVFIIQKIQARHLETEGWDSYLEFLNYANNAFSHSPTIKEILNIQALKELHLSSEDLNPTKRQKYICEILDLSLQNHELGIDTTAGKYAKILIQYWKGQDKLDFSWEIFEKVHKYHKSNKKGTKIFTEDFCHEALGVFQDDLEKVSNIIKYIEESEQISFSNHVYDRIIFIYGKHKDFDQCQSYVKKSVNDANVFQGNPDFIVSTLETFIYVYINEAQSSDPFENIYILDRFKDTFKDTIVQMKENNLCISGKAWTSIHNLYSTYATHCKKDKRDFHKECVQFFQECSKLLDDKMPPEYQLNLLDLHRKANETQQEGFNEICETCIEQCDQFSDSEVSTVDLCDYAYIIKLHFLLHKVLHQKVPDQKAIKDFEATFKNPVVDNISRHWIRYLCIGSFFIYECQQQEQVCCPSLIEKVEQNKNVLKQARIDTTRNLKSIFDIQRAMICIFSRQFREIVQDNASTLEDFKRFFEELFEFFNPTLPNCLSHQDIKKETKSIAEDLKDYHWKNINPADFLQFLREKQIHLPSGYRLISDTIKDTETILSTKSDQKMSAMSQEDKALEKPHTLQLNNYDPHAELDAKAFALSLEKACAVSDYNKLIESCAIYGNDTQVHTVYTHMLDHNVYPDSDTFKAIFSGQSPIDRGRILMKKLAEQIRFFREAIRVFNEMFYHHEMILDDDAFNDLKSITNDTYYNEKKTCYSIKKQLINDKGIAGDQLALLVKKVTDEKEEEIHDFTTSATSSIDIEIISADLYFLLGDYQKALEKYTEVNVNLQASESNQQEAQKQIKVLLSLLE